MAIPTEVMRTNFDLIVSNYGRDVTITTFTHKQVIAGSYDDEYITTGSQSIGSASAVFQPLGPNDAQYLPEGIVIINPHKMYVAGSVNTGQDMIIKDQAGSWFEVIPGKGVMRWANNGSVVYQEAWVRGLQASGAYI